MSAVAIRPTSSRVAHADLSWELTVLAREWMIEQCSTDEDADYASEMGAREVARHISRYYPDGIGGFISDHSFPPLF